MKLVPISEARRGFLADWLLERRIDLLLRQEQVENRSAAEAAPSAESGNRDLSVGPAPFDACVRMGEVRLLSGFALEDPWRMAYVAVLDTMPYEGAALVAPFSPYASPATKGEWLTGLKASPLRVLQLWNAQPASLQTLARSWRCCKLETEELNAAKTIYRHILSGSLVPFPLREGTGVSVLSSSDARLEYEDEEFALYGPLRESLYLIHSMAERPLNLHVLSAAVRVLDGHWEVPAPALLAAADGSVVVPWVQIAEGDGPPPFPARAASAECIGHGNVTDPAGSWESRWILQVPEGVEPPPPGCVVEAYAPGKPPGTLPFASGFTADDGRLVLFAGSDGGVLLALGGGNAKGEVPFWMVIRRTEP